MGGRRGAHRLEEMFGGVTGFTYCKNDFFYCTLLYYILKYAFENSNGSNIREVCQKSF